MCAGCLRHCIIAKEVGLRVPASCCATETLSKQLQLNPVLGSLLAAPCDTYRVALLHCMHACRCNIVPHPRASTCLTCPWCRSPAALSSLLMRRCTSGCAAMLNLCIKSTDAQTAAMSLQACLRHSLTLQLSLAIRWRQRMAGTMKAGLLVRAEPHKPPVCTQSLRGRLPTLHARCSACQVRRTYRHHAMVWLEVSKPARMKAPISGSSCSLVRGLPAGQHRGE